MRDKKNGTDDSGDSEKRWALERAASAIYGKRLHSWSGGNALSSLSLVFRLNGDRSVTLVDGFASTDPLS